MPTLINMQDIDDKHHDARKYVKLKMYFASSNNYVCIERELHIVNNLSVKIFIDVNIMISEKMNISIKCGTIIINACENMIVLISIRVKDQTVHTSIFNKKRIVVLIHTMMLIDVVDTSIKLNLLCDRNFMFKSEALNKLSVYTHIIDANITSVFVQNDFNQSIMLPRQACMNKIIEYDIMMCCLMNASEISMMTKLSKN